MGAAAGAPSSFVLSHRAPDRRSISSPTSIPSPLLHRPHHARSWSGVAEARRRLRRTEESSSSRLLPPRQDQAQSPRHQLHPVSLSFQDGSAPNTKDLQALLGVPCYHDHNHWTRLIL